MNESSFVRCWPKARELVNIMLKLAQIFFGLLFTKHLIFYRMLNEEEIEIIRILGADMDLKNRIKE